MNRQTLLLAVSVLAGTACGGGSGRDRADSGQDGAANDVAGDGSGGNEGGAPDLPAGDAPGGEAAADKAGDGATDAVTDKPGAGGDGGAITCGDFLPDCPSGMVCNYGPMMCGKGTLSGTCVAKPTGACGDSTPVCGCNGKTYDTDCDRLKAGEQLDHTGPCSGGLDAGGDVGPLSCGTMTCGDTQVCVHPCLGGAMFCDPPPDGGACPMGSPGPCMLPGGGSGCLRPPSPPYCFDLPGSCAGVPSCMCLSSSVCCSVVTDRHVMCFCP